MKKDFSFSLTDGQKITGSIEEAEYKRMLNIIDENIDNMPYDFEDVDESIDLFNLDDKSLEITSSVSYEGSVIPNEVLKLFVTQKLKELLDEALHNLSEQEEEFDNAPSDEFSLPRYHSINHNQIFIGAEYRIEELVDKNPKNKNYEKLYDQITDIVMALQDVLLFTHQLKLASDKFRENHLDNSLLSVLSGDSSRAFKLLNIALDSTNTKEFLDNIEEATKDNFNLKVFKIEGGEPIFGNRFLIEGSEAEEKYNEAVRLNTLLEEAEKQGLVLVIDTETGEEKMLEPGFNNPELIDFREEDKKVYKYKSVRPYNNQGLKVEFLEFNNAGSTDKLGTLLEGLNITSKGLNDTLVELRSKSQDLIDIKKKTASLISKLPKDKKNKLFLDIK